MALRLGLECHDSVCLNEAGRIGPREVVCNFSMCLTARMFVSAMFGGPIPPGECQVQAWPLHLLGDPVGTLRWAPRRAESFWFDRFGSV